MGKQDDDIDSVLLARLARLLQPYQLEELLDVCETAAAGGRGYYSVEISFTNGGVDIIEGRFTRKPRRSDQGDASKWR